MGPLDSHRSSLNDMARVLVHLTLLALVVLSLGEPEPGKPKGRVVSYRRSYGPPQASYQQPQPSYRPTPQPKYKPVKAKAKAPKFELPKLPKLKFPKFELPKLPKFKLPKFKAPKAPKAPKSYKAKSPKKGSAPAYAPPPQPVQTPS